MPRRWNRDQQLHSGAGEQRKRCADAAPDDLDLTGGVISYAVPAADANADLRADGPADTGANRRANRNSGTDTDADADADAQAEAAETQTHADAYAYTVAQARPALLVRKQRQRP